MKRIALPRAAVAGLVAVALTGCAASAPTADDGELRIVASTNVYGSIARAILGDEGHVTSIINDASQDPHSYEATAQDQLAVAKADIIIANGGGYDPFVRTLLSAVANEGVVVIQAIDVPVMLGDVPDAHGDHGDAADDDAADDHAADPADPADVADHDDHDDHGHREGFNEHVWYSLQAMDELAERIAHELSEADTPRAAHYAANLEEFRTSIEALKTTAQEIRDRFAGEGAAVTEPVPLYLLEQLGLVDRTPEGFSEAVEGGTDVPPAVFQRMLRVIEGRDIRVLVYNDQTSGPQTERVLRAAGDAGIPAVGVTETLPEGEDYPSWMADNLAELERALDTAQATAHK